MHSLLHSSSSIAQLNPSASFALSFNTDHAVCYAASFHPHLHSISVWSIDFHPNQHQSRLVGTLESLSPLDANHSTTPLTIIDLKFLPESCQLCLITSDGRISLCGIADQQNDIHHPESQFDNIGTFEDGIRAASWSPDDELLVIITNSDKLVVLTKSFDVLSENQIDYARFGDDQPINLGWGTKATQFHGSLGKAAAQASDSSAPPDSIQSSNNSSNAYQISWRGDGAFFAISCPGRRSQDNLSPRLIKVYSRAASLSSSSESIPNSQLGDKIAWKPDGSIIASSVRNLKNDTLNIIFFERNGLQRYGFDLNETDLITNIWGLAWNSDSSILAVGIEKRRMNSAADGDYRSIYAVQLWTRNNYHWYLKHEAQSDLCTQSTSAFVPSMMWHAEQPQCIYLNLAAGFVEMRKFVWESLQDVKPKPHDTGSVAVIDGYQILLTPFRFQVVPPPMSSFQLSTQPAPSVDNPRIPTHVAFSPRSQLLCSIRPDGYVNCYHWPIPPGTTPSSTLARPSQSLCFNLKIDPQTRILCRQIAMMDLINIQASTQDRNLVVIILFSEVGQENQLRDGVHVQRLGNIKPEHETFDSTCEDEFTRLYAPPKEEWWKVFTCGMDGYTYIQTSEGLIKKVSCEQSNSSTLFSIETMQFRLPEFCPIIQCIKLMSSSAQDSNLTRAVGLTRFGKLYLNQELVANDCSSFATDSDYLIYTNYSHQLKFIELTELIRGKKLSSDPSDDVLAQQSQPTVNDTASSMIRAVERGSIIVTNVPSSMKIILQMPRGNLEAIHPRPMVLRTICLDYLKNEKWKEAFTECRKHKIDLNLLVDFDRNQFLKQDGGLLKFINQVDNNDFFCLFLTSLKLIDVTQELYPITQNWKPEQKDKSNVIRNDEKINAVCNLMVDQLTQKQSHLCYINSILTAMVCKKPPDYTSSLSLLSSLKSEYPEKLEDAVKYMIFLSDVNELYRFALSIYDLSLVVLIAQHSQKDPKEYLPFLQSLRDLEPNKLRFRIDDYLGNYSSGLKNLSLSLKDKEAGNELDSILKYTKLHHLYKEALEIYSQDLVMTQALRNIQGDWLMEMNKPFEAGLAYMLAGQIKKAVEGYKQAEAWQEMFALIVQNSNDFDLLESAKDMANRLSGSGRFIEAAAVLTQFGDDIRLVISTLCDGQAFSQAILTALSKSKSGYSLITEIILPSAGEFSKIFLEELDQLMEDLKKQVDRLEELKLARETNPDLFFLAGGQKNEEDNPLDGADAMTEATTIFRTDYSRYTRGVSQSGQSIVSSRSGRSSAKSSKMRKKEAKKKAIGKKGSIYEEEYLLNTLSKMCTQKLPELHNTIGSLLPALVQLMTFTKQQSSTTSSSLIDESAIQEIIKNLQNKFEKFQQEISKQVEKIWSQNPIQQVLLQENNQNDNNSVNLRVPKPLLPPDLLQSTWKLGFI